MNQPFEDKNSEDYEGPESDAEDSAEEEDEEETSSSEDSGETEAESPAKEEPKAAKPAQVPRDFPLRIATRIITINEREMDEHVANSRVADLVYRNLKDPELHNYLLDAVDILLHNNETQRYGGRVWVALNWGEDEHPEYLELTQSVLTTCAEGHRYNRREMWEDAESARSFSYFAYIIGESFIQMMKVTSEMYDVVTDMFTHIIRMEMTKDLDEKENKERMKKLPRARQRKEDSANINPKKL